MIKKIITLFCCLVLLNNLIARTKVVINPEKRTIKKTIPDAISLTKMDCDIAMAGDDEYVCGNSVQLQANTPMFSIGQWFLVDEEGIEGLLDDINSPTATITGELGFTYLLEWRIAAFGDCAESSDMVYITFDGDADEDGIPNCSDPAPCEIEFTIANAGLDQLDICDNGTFLEANFPDVGYGQWYLVGEGDIDNLFSNIFDPQATLLGEYGETYILEWEITDFDYFCPGSRDTVIISFSQIQTMTSFQIVWISVLMQMILAQIWIWTRW